MDAKTFLSAFAFAADSPGGVDRLRQLVLDLAVRGRLTGQDPDDEPAAELLQRIAEERERMIEEKEIRRPRAYSPPSRDELPFSIPSNWAWSRTVDLVHTVNGRAFKPTDWSPEGLPIVRIQNLNRPDAPFNRYDGEVDPKFLVDPGDLLISWSGTPGTSFGAFVWNGPSGILNQHIFKCRLYGGYRDFIQLAVNSRLDVLIGDARGGVGLQHFTKDKLERLVLPVPPLAEQRRIAQRVSELMTLCDALDQKIVERGHARSALTRSTLRHLSEAQSADEVRSYLTLFVDGVAPQLAPGRESVSVVSEIRRTILELAVRGRLTEQEQKDEPAGELLKRVYQERDRLVSAKEIRKQPEFPPVDDDAQSTALPRGWAWSRLSSVCVVQPGVARVDGDPEVPFLPMEKIHAGWQEQPAPVFRQWSSVKSGYTKFRSGDLLLAKITPCFQNRKSCVVPDLEPGFGAGTTELFVLRPHSGVVPRFILAMLKSPSFVAHGEQMMTGTAGQQRIPRAFIDEYVVAIPPTAEQLRIVEKIDELMPLCDELEAQYVAAESVGVDLTASLVAHVL